MKTIRAGSIISFFILASGLCINTFLYGAWRMTGDSIGDGEGVPVFIAETESRDKAFTFAVSFPSDGPCVPSIDIFSKGAVKFKMRFDNKPDNALILFPSSKEYSLDTNPGNEKIYTAEINRRQFDALMADFKKEKQFTLSIVSSDNKDIIINKIEFDLNNAVNTVQSACKECEAAYLKGTDFIMENSGKRTFNKEDIQRLRLLSQNLLQIARNEIFARHGYIFSNPDMIKVFSAKKWYKPAKKEVTLSAIEKSNVDLIKSMEKE